MTDVICFLWYSLILFAGCKTTISIFSESFTASIAAEPVSPLVATITKPLSPSSVNLLSAIAPSGCNA